MLLHGEQAVHSNCFCGEGRSLEQNKSQLFKTWYQNSALKELLYRGVEHLNQQQGLKPQYLQARANESECQEGEDIFHSVESFSTLLCWSHTRASSTKSKVRTTLYSIFIRKKLIFDSSTGLADQVKLYSINKYIYIRSQYCVFF